MTTIRKIVLSGILLAFGIILPFFTGQLQQLGQMMLPMHIPVLLCGIVCGWQYGLTIGLILPLLRFFMFGMPKLFPTGIAMSVELASYGAIIGIVYMLLPKKFINIYVALIASMTGGRIIFGIVKYLLLTNGENPYTFSIFIGEAFFNALPGIILQFFVIPLILAAAKVTGNSKDEN